MAAANITNRIHLFHFIRLFYVAKKHRTKNNHGIVPLRLRSGPTVVFVEVLEKVGVSHGPATLERGHPDEKERHRASGCLYYSFEFDLGDDTERDIQARAWGASRTYF